MTPVVVFAYNRPRHVAKALEALSRCERLDECRVHVYCDGPKGPDGAGAVAETRAAVREWAGKLGAEVVERPENFGLARSIVTAVTDLCERHGRVIVLEDDLIVSPDFLDYMLQALDRYARDDRVWQISGFMFPIDTGVREDAFFLPLASTWGWATWQRAWRKADWQASGALEALNDADTRRRFNLDGSYPYDRMLTDRLQGRNNSWGVLWWWSVFAGQGLVLQPRTSLIYVAGWDGSGTHGGESAPFTQEPATRFTARRLSHPLRLPGNVAVDTTAMVAVTHYLRATARPAGRAWLRRLAQLVQRVFT